MFGVAPRARFRLYTKSRDYWHLAGNVLLGRSARGDDVQRLEQAMCRKVGAPYAIAVPQGRVGIYLVIKHLIRPGQKVIVSPYTIADVINMVICAGGVPVFADINRDTTNISASDVEQLIDENTGAVMVTHLHGIPCDIVRIAAICRAKNVPLIEDSAQTFGALVNGKILGTFGDAGIYSFGMYKNVTAFYGGMIVANNETLYHKIKKEVEGYPFLPLGWLLTKARKALFSDIATLPMLFKPLVFWIFRFGYLHDIHAINKHVMVELDTSRRLKIPDNFMCRLRPVQARIVLRQLEPMDEFSATRIRYAKIYHEGLRDIKELIIPPFRDDGSHIYNYFPIQYADRVKLVKWAMKHRRDFAIQHLKNCASLPGFATEFRECPNAQLTADQTILLPNYPSYGEEEVKKNVAVIRKFFDRSTRP